MEDSCGRGGALLGEFNDGRIIENKMQEINNWERNNIFDEVENKGQKTINI